MKPLIKPERLRPGDTIATISISGGRAGVMSYYGPNLLTPIAQPGSLDSYTENAIRKALFSDEKIGLVEPCQRHTPIEWRDMAEGEIVWRENSGYQVVQGRGKAQGRLLGGTLGPLNQIMGTEAFPTQNMWKDCLVFIENGSPYGSTLAGLHGWRALAACGVLGSCAGLITPAMDPEETDILRRVLKYEVGRE